MSSPDDSREANETSRAPHGEGGGAHLHAPSTAARLRLAFFLVLLVLVVEVAVAILSGSLALLADAAHVLTDIVAIALSWYAVRQAARPADPKRTYGYHRVGILVALFNSVTLVLIALYILREAWGRLFEPVAVQGGMMIIAALVGVFVNLWVGRDLSQDHSENLNVKSAVLHVLGDAAASVGVIIAALLMWWQPTWTWVDPVIAALIGLLVAFGAWRILYDAVVVLLEGVPSNVDMDALVRAVVAVPGVSGVHDLHVWSIASGLPALTCHVLVREIDVVSTAAVLNGVREVLADSFGIHHVTLQPEWEMCGPDNLFCTRDLLRPSASPHRHA